MITALRSHTWFYHVLAILTVMIWGTTFVSTKILINAGLSPIEILFYRFTLAYVCLFLTAHKRFFAQSWKDELLLMLSGLCGGSLYFIAENTALGITFASNVSLLICTAPIFTLFLSKFFYKERLRRKVLYGSLIASLRFVDCLNRSKHGCPERKFGIKNQSVRRLSDTDCRHLLGIVLLDIEAIRRQVFHPIRYPESFLLRTGLTINLSLLLPDRV